VSIAGENSMTDKYQADVKVKGGAIIPLGKVIQNTTQYNLDSLTLIVSLDKTGKAKGKLYEDAGDGFGYKKGRYQISEFTASKKGPVVQVTVKHLAGGLTSPSRKYKVIVVTNKGVYSGLWVKGANLSLPLTDANKQ